jgi:hypothetical protein
VLADVGVTTDTDVVRFVLGVDVRAGVADAGREDLARSRRITSRTYLFGPVRAANIASIIHPVSADVEQETTRMEVLCQVYASLDLFSLQNVIGDNSMLEC